MAASYILAQSRAKHTRPLILIEINVALLAVTDIL
jgi:hypothetical protein